MSGRFRDQLDGTRTKYAVSFTAQFRRGHKLARKRGLKREAPAQAIALLANGQALPGKNRGHALSGVWSGCRECHIQPGWLSSIALRTTYWC